jgi:hypothetical protein
MKRFVLSLILMLGYFVQTTSACDLFASCAPAPAAISGYGAVNYGASFNAFAVQPAYAAAPVVQAAVYATPLEVAAPVAVRTFAYAPVSIASYSPTIGVNSFHPVAINRSVVVNRNAVVVNRHFGVNRAVVVNNGFGRNVVVNRAGVFNRNVVVNRNFVNRNVVVRPGGLRVNGFGASRVIVRGR